MIVDFFVFLISLFPALGGISTTTSPIVEQPKTPSILQKHHFQHTFSYEVFHGKNGMKCQATRINSRWFVTAAHCVKDICRKSCTIEMDLLDSAVSVKATEWHNTYHYTVFIHPGYKKTKAAKDDFALIRLDPTKAAKTYYKRSTPQDPRSGRISSRQFFRWLKQSPAKQKKYQALFHFSPPQIMEFEGGNYEILQTLFVVSIVNGKRTVKQSNSPIYYVKNLGLAYTNDFGIRKGMSGSGVISEEKDLVGIISSNIKEDFYDGNQKIAGRNWFMFPVFNEEVIAFMQATMGEEFNTLKIKKAYPSIAKKTDKDFSSIRKLAVQAKPSKK